MNNQFILNNELRKHCHLENLGFLLVFESLVCLCYSAQRAQATVSVSQVASGDHPGRLPWFGFSNDCMVQGTHTEASHFSDHCLCRRTDSTQLCDLQAHLKAPFVVFFSSVHWVPLLGCSWPGVTRSLQEGILPIYPDTELENAQVIMDNVPLRLGTSYMKHMPEKPLHRKTS